jgi:ribonuclease P protein component
MTGSDASIPLPARDASNRSQGVVNGSVAKTPRGCRPAAHFVHLRKRPDFLRVGKGARFHVRTFSLHMAKASFDPSGPADTIAGSASPRFGFTVTRKTGGSVERNRIRRRLREALLTPEGKAWLQDVEDKIAAQRTLLSPPVVEDETTKTWVTE